MVDITNINNQIADKVTSVFTSSVLVTTITWGIFGLLCIAGVGYYLYWSLEKKKFSKFITAFELFGDYFEPTVKDKAMTVKLGKGGFEVLYLKRLKTWKLAYGGRIGKNDYYFFIDSVGYWFNGKLSGIINQLDKFKGLIPIVTTNPLMRAQYTALEKQIDSLHSEKQSFWDKYGQWVMTITFAVIIGIFSWLSFREIHQFLGSGSALADQMLKLAEAMNKLAINLNNANSGGTGLVP